MEKIDIHSNLFKELFDNNFLSRLKRVPEFKAYRVGLESGMIELIIPPGTQDLEHNWVHTVQKPDKDCKTLLLIFKAFDFIPTRCLSCWKVVVKPRTVVELFKLYNIQVELNEHCKCGIETDRPHVNALYGGYFYTDTKQEGMERCLQVRKAVDEGIGKDVPVILKRYCTEMELKFGDSKGYQQPRAAKKWEAMVDKWFVKYPPGMNQSPIVVHDIMERWIHFAMQFGDQSVKEINNGEFLYSQPRTYHNEEV